MENKSLPTNQCIVVRDEKGRFTKGHPTLNIQPGKKGGRPKTVEGQVKDALKVAEDAMPQIIGMLKRQALKGNVDAAKYLCDRIYGKPNQPISSPDGVPLQSFIFILPGGQHLTARQLFERSQSVPQEGN